MKKSINISDIIVPEAFRLSRPSKNKISRGRRFFKQYGCIDKPIVVDNDNNLIDGYIRYLILLENKVDIIQVQIYGVTYKNTSTTYVFGKHPHVDKEFVWRMTRNTINKDALEVGSKVIVNTTKGMRAVW
jgi:hypothetical protein